MGVTENKFLPEPGVGGAGGHEDDEPASLVLLLELRKEGVVGRGGRDDGAVGEWGEEFLRREDGQVGIFPREVSGKPKHPVCC